MTSVFALPARLETKNDPALIGDDESRFAAIADALTSTIDDLQTRLESLRRQTGHGQDVLQRDLEVHRVEGRLKALRRAGLDLCLGKVVGEGEPVFVGRSGLTGPDGRRLLVDWRSPAAEPFFAATHAHPMGLTSRRRYRWTGGRITDYWDEVFDGLDETRAALDDQSAFIASLGASRSPRMRDVLSTIAADQDAIVRAGSKGALVVDGGPGTGKTVVALHRTAFLLHADPRLGHRRGGVLFVGPHRPYLDYVSDVLPSLGEEGVLTCTIADLVPEGPRAEPETDPRVAALKRSGVLVDAIDPAVRLYEEPPAEPENGQAWQWAEAFASAEGPHDQAREEVWAELLELTADEEDLEPAELREEFDQHWPLLDPLDVVADLFSVPAYLRRCAPSLTREEVRLLQGESMNWTQDDLPLLDAARHRVGNPRDVRERARRERERLAERDQRAAVVADLIAADDSEMHLMSMLRGDDLQNALDEGEPPNPDALGGPFAHVVVDEAQELTDAQWRMLVRRCPSRSFTIVGDRAQARHGFEGTWVEHLQRVGLGTVEVASLTVNYRTPEEVMAVAEPVIRAVLPDANVPTSIRRSGVPVHRGGIDELDELLGQWVAGQEGVACVIGAAGVVDRPRVRSLTPELAKGLEFDLVVLVDAERMAPVDRYVAMTRATQRLVLLSSDELSAGGPSPRPTPST